MASSRERDEDNGYGEVTEAKKWEGCASDVIYFFVYFVYYKD